MLKCHEMVPKGARLVGEAHRDGRCCRPIHEGERVVLGGHSLQGNLAPVAGHSDVFCPKHPLIPSTLSPPGAQYRRLFHVQVPSSLYISLLYAILDYNLGHIARRPGEPPRVAPLGATVLARSAAATLIQARYRGYRTRKRSAGPAARERPRPAKPSHTEGLRADNHNVVMVRRNKCTGQ